MRIVWEIPQQKGQCSNIKVVFVLKSTEKFVNFKIYLIVNKLPLHKTAVLLTSKRFLSAAGQVVPRGEIRIAG